MSGEVYAFEEDRDYMYCTLRAIFKAVVAAKVEVLFIPDFGCTDACHPPKEISSLMYKVVHEYCGHFQAVLLAIAPQRTHSTDTTTNLEIFQRAFQKPSKHLLAWK
jgi:hypothetical protein